MKYTQNNRFIRIFPPIGENILHVVSISGHEGISQLYQYNVQVDVARDEEHNVTFDALIGKPVLVTHRVDKTKERCYHGIVTRLSRTGQGREFCRYDLQLSPSLWLLTRITNCRTFQQLSVPDILRQVLKSFTVEYQLQGTYEKRDFVVQYRESDFAFISRLMEEEGISYFFEHAEDSHKLILRDNPQAVTDLPVRGTLELGHTERGQAVEEKITAWGKSQYLRSGKVKLWDHSFELPGRNLEAEEAILEKVRVGLVDHKLRLANDNLELFDYPGEYAQRFDGIAPGGGEQPAEVQKIFNDNQRTTKLRMEQEAVNTLLCEATSDFAGIIPGYKFSLTGTTVDDGLYLITEADFHHAQGSSLMSGDAAGQDAVVEVNFQAIPFALPFRPPRVTPKPAIHGTQTAVVTGPENEEIFTDKYGRIKVQFPWDRLGTQDANSSCWVRVVTNWAGKNFGVIFIPRVGMEVVIVFEEGDPDRPLCVGAVYNADTMPPWALPDNKTQSGIKTRSSTNASNIQTNILRFEDMRGEEDIFLHAQKNLDVRILNDRLTHVGNDDHFHTVNNRIGQIDNNDHLKIGTNQYIEIGSDHHLKIGGKAAIQVGETYSLKVNGNVAIESGGNISLKASGNIVLDAGNIVLQASSICAMAGGSHVAIGSPGVTAKGAAEVVLEGSMVRINSGPGSPAVRGQANTIVSPTAPTAPTEPLKPDESGTTRYTSSGALASVTPPPPRFQTGNSQQPGPEEGGATQPRHWIEVLLVDKDNLPVPGEAFEITLPDGTVATGTTDENGKGRVDGIDPGTAVVRWPNIDRSALS